MKGIKVCGACNYYDWKKHKCKICTDKGKATDPFYTDCPLPDVEEVKHGHWYNNFAEYFIDKLGNPYSLEEYEKMSMCFTKTKFYCSVCGAVIERKERSPYCKWCGARMDGEK